MLLCHHNRYDNNGLIREIDIMEWKGREGLSDRGGGGVGVAFPKRTKVISNEYIP